MEEYGDVADREERVNQGQEERSGGANRGGRVVIFTQRVECASAMGARVRRQATALDPPAGSTFLIVTGATSGLT